MREISIPIPEIALIAGTRGALGIGIGLLLADTLTREQRQAAGVALVAIGVLTTIPLVADILGRRRCAKATHQPRQSSPMAAPLGV